MSLKVWLPLNGDLTNKGGSKDVFTGTPAYSTGKVSSQCLTNTELTCSSSTIPTDLSSNNQYSVCAWVKGTATSVWIWEIGSGTGTTRGLWVYNGYPSLGYSGSAAFTGTTKINNGIWHHVCFTVNGAVGKVYVDGTYCGGDSVKTEAIAGSSILVESQTGYDINDFRIYNHCLSSIEVRELANGLVVHYKLDDITNGIVDSSGYGHNGTISGTIVTENESPRYSSSIYLDGSSHISTAAGTMAWYPMDKGTLACWMKPTANMSGWRGSWGICQDGNYSTKGFAITDYDNVFQFTWTNGSNYQLKSSGISLPQNEWHHCAITLDGTLVKMYFDGELVKTETIEWGTATTSTNARIELGIDFPGTDERFTGNYSDARFYVTPLLDKDIKMLYNISMRINKPNNIYSREFKENSSGEQINLPAEYKQVESIGAVNARPYINTGLYMTGEVECEIRYYNDKTEAFLFGARKNTSSTPYCNFNIESTDNRSRWDYGSMKGNSSRYFNSVHDGEYYFTFHNRIALITNITTNQTFTSDLTSSTFSTLTNRNLYLFAVNTNGTLNSGSVEGTLRIYSAKIWIGGELEANYIPCVRKSDNVAGMYDLVTETFFTSQNSDTFTPGPELNNSLQPQKLTKRGQLIGNNFKEYQKSSFYKNGLIEATEFIEI